MPGNVIVVFGLLHLEVQVHAFGGPMVEYDRPLIQLAAVVMQFVITMNERPNIVAIAASVVGQERECVAAFPGQVVDRTDQSLSLAVLPGRIAVRQSLTCGLPGFQRHPVWFARDRVVKVGIAQQRLGSVGTCFQKVTARCPRTANNVCRRIAVDPGLACRGRSCRWA